MQLTSEQQRAVTCTSPKIIMEAGAGAGKTKVLCERVAWLLKEAPPAFRLTPFDICLITFTNEACHDLKGKLLETLKQKHLEMCYPALSISTIDSLFSSCIEILYPKWWESVNLKYSGQGTGRPDAAQPPELVFLEDQQLRIGLELGFQRFLKNCAFNSQDLVFVMDFLLSGGFKKNPFGGQSPWESLIQLMGQEQLLSVRLEDILLTCEKTHPAHMILIEKIYVFARQEYEKRLLAGTLSYADRTVFLKEHSASWSCLSFQELIVDEYQDTSQCQSHDILNSWADQSQARFVVVGDPKQSIYGFRNASVEVFQSILLEAAGQQRGRWEHIQLCHNFRSEKSLLDQINTLAKISFGTQKENLSHAYRSSFFYKESLKKHVPHQAMLSTVDSSGPTGSMDPNGCVHVVSVNLEPEQTSPKKKTDPLPCSLNEFTEYVFGSVLLDFQEKYHVGWDQMAVLCENNQQIENLKKSFEKRRIPIVPSLPKKHKTVPHDANRVSLSLLKWLTNTHTPLDVYEVLNSPLSPFSHGELEDHFAGQGNERMHDFIKLVEDAQHMAKQHVFYAWQTLRWRLAFDTCAQSQTQESLWFCLYMDNFAKSLCRRWALSWPVHIERWVIGENPQDISSAFSMPHVKGLELKTIHSAKGLEWDYVFFYAKLSKNMSGHGFTVHKSSQNLHINWLNEDVESLSAIARTTNQKFLDQDHEVHEGKVIWFSDLRQKMEEEFERQRVFYTAFTRARKGIVFIQPQHSAVSKKSFLQKKIKSFEELTFEQKIFAQYLKYCTAETPAAVKVHHFDHTYYLEHASHLAGMKKNHGEVPSGGRKQHAMVDIEKFGIQPPSTVSNASVPNTKDCSAPKGTVMEQCVRHKAIPLDALVAQKSKFCFREFEIWSLGDPGVVGPLTQRHVLDFVALISVQELRHCCVQWGGSQNALKAHLQGMQGYVALVLDFKTGRAQQSHHRHMEHDLGLVAQWCDSVPFVKEFACDQPLIFLGILLYSQRKLTIPKKRHVVPSSVSDMIVVPFQKAPK